MKYTTVVDFQECWCMSLLFPTNALSTSFIFSIHLSSDQHCECMLFHSWLQHAMTASVTYSCFLSCSSSLVSSSFSAPVVSLLQFSLNWLSGSGISFLLKSVLAHPFLMQPINPSLVWFSVVISCSFWVFECFSFSLSFWWSSKFSFAPASWTSKLLIGFILKLLALQVFNLLFPLLQHLLFQLLLKHPFVFNQHVCTFVQTAEFYWASAKSPSCNSFCCMLVHVINQSPACAWTISLSTCTSVSCVRKKTHISQQTVYA